MTEVAALNDACYSYGSVLAVDHLDLRVRQGEVLAVLGPNGAGKSTAISLLLGLLRPDSGSCSVFGMPPMSLGARIRRGAMLQTSGVPGTLKVAEHLDLFRAYYPRPLDSSRLIETAGLKGIENKRFDQLSGGQKQRLLFALALAGDPALVFLDEPTTGLDIDARRRLWNEIRRLRADGRTVVLTTHYLEEADALADRVMVIDHGRMLAEGTPSEIKARTAGRIIRCTTRLGQDDLLRMTGVTHVEHSGTRVEVLATDPESVLRSMLAADQTLADLEVTGVDLETAFLSLTRNGEQETSQGEAA